MRSSVRRLVQSFVFLISFCGLFETVSAQWTQSNYTSNDVQAMLVNGADLFAGTSQGVYRSTDHGATWTAANGNISAITVYALTAVGTCLFEGGFNGGVYRSTNSGSNWTAVNTGLTNTSVWALATIGTRVFAGTWGGGVCVSADSGKNWSDVSAGLPDLHIHALAVIGTTLYASVWSNGVYSSTDYGTTWNPAKTGLGQYAAVLSLFVNGSALYAGTYVDIGVYATTDGGSNWNASSSGLANPSSIWSLAGNGSNLFAGNYDGVYVSTDNGATWNVSSTSLTNPPIYSLAVSGTNVVAGTHGSGIWVCGITQALPVELVSLTVEAHSASVNLRWMTATETNSFGFEVERQAVSGWTPVGFVQAAGTTANSHTYSFTDRDLKTGSYAYRLKQIDRNGSFKYSGIAEVEIGAAPKQFTLGQNYPNPFNPSTSIEFTLEHNGKATLKIFNVLGQEVATVFDQAAEAGKIYHAQFNASHLATGVYMSVLESGGKRLFRKMLLVK